MGRANWVLGVVFALTLASSANAAVVGTRVQQYDANTRSEYVVFTAEPGEANELRVSLEARVLRLVDEGAELFAGNGCTQVGPHEVTCPAQGLSIALDDMDDTVSSGAPASIAAGDGDDHVELAGGGVSAGAGADVVEGSHLAEGLTGGPGPDKLAGGGGDDRFSERSDDGSMDILSGGAGHDRIDYSTPGFPLSLDLSQPAPNGGAGENDTLLSIESAQASGESVRLVGSERANELTAFASGGDPLAHGRNTVIGGAGSDTIRAESEFDRDEVVAGPGHDEITLDSGWEHPVPDDVSCGPGRDHVWGPNRRTLIPDDCERVEPGGGTQYELATRVYSLEEEVLGAESYDCTPRRPCRRFAVAIHRADARGRPVGPVLARDVESGVPRLSLRLNSLGRVELRRKRRLRVAVRAFHEDDEIPGFLAQLRYRP